jgi:UDP-glucose-4-epimerase GalE
VGSHAVRALLERDERLVVLDDLSAGHVSALPARPNVELIRVDLAGADAAQALDALFARESFEAVLHFGAKAYVAESVRDPGTYYRTNVGGGIELLRAMARHDVSAVIFSSTCATYGVPERVPIEEGHPQKPVNPYGRTKLVLEQALSDFETAHSIRHVNLRYFNAAGAHESGELGEDHRPETHLIPLAIAAALGGATLPVYGNDYDTPDGTCIRDYVHVQDLADAHVLALDHLRRGGPSRSYNLGTGEGHSVVEVIEAVERVGGRKVPHATRARRAGDPPRLVASASKARNELNYSPRLSQIDRIVETAWRFKERFPDGYPHS